MATTTNYGWTTPDDTDLVKDGAAAIRTLGSSVDTTTKALNPSTTLGDIEYRSSTANTNTRLGIGSSGQVLAVSGGVPAWTTPGGASANFSLLSTTTLTGASTFTVSGLSGYNTFFCTIASAVVSGSNNTVLFRINGDTGANYNRLGIKLSPSSSYALGIFEEEAQLSQTSVALYQESSSANSQSSGYFRIEGANSTGVKMFHSAFGTYNDGGFSSSYPIIGGYMNNSSVISSITLFSANSFTGGSLRIYGSVA